MDFSTIDLESIIKEEWLPTYKEELRIIWDELVKINSGLLILDRILKFPFHLFGVYGERSPFWDITFVSIFESVILSLWKITQDGNVKSFTIYKWKHAIFRNMKSREFQSLVGNDIQDIMNRIEQHKVKKRLENLRNSVISHLQKDWALTVSTGVSEGRKVYVRELRTLCDDVNTLFHSLCFNHEYPVLPIDYYLASHGDRKEVMDIERLLEHVANDSNVIRFAEEDPEEWEEARKEYSEGDLEIINYYRSRLGLPPA